MNLKEKIKKIALTISAFLIPIFQYVPCASIWRGIMSIPLITYLIFFISQPDMIICDFQIFFTGSFPVIGGLILFLYSLIYLYRRNNCIIETGPYKYVRHPQYLGIIVMTFGLTLLSLGTSPVMPITLNEQIAHIIIIFIWFGEVLAYIILAKIEELSLKSKFGDIYLKYTNNVPFMIPFLKLKKHKNIKEIKNKNHKETNLQW